MPNRNRKPHSPFFAVVAVLLAAFFGGSLAAPCVRVFVAAPVETVLVSASQKFAGVTPQVPHNTACVCVACPGMHGGKCCCATAPTTGDGYALRAVCDVAPDAASPMSFLPPMVLPRGVSAIAPVFAPANALSCPAAPRLCAALDSPLPPDAPPRLS